MGIRPVPSRLEPELRGFLQDIRNEIGNVTGGSFKLVLLGDMRTALSGDFISYGDIAKIIADIQDSVRNDPFFQELGQRVNLITGTETLPGSVNARLTAAKELLQTGIDANGSAIVTLQETTAEQAVSITLLGTRVGTNESNITSLFSTTSTQANQLSSLTTRTSASENNIVTLQQTTANQATSISLLSSTVNGNTAAIQTLQATTNGLSAEYSVRLDVNGRVVGFGIYNNGTSSAFYVRADRFAVGDSSAGNRIPFIVDGGVVYIDTVMIRDASIGGAKIANAAITNAKIGDYIASGGFNGDAGNPAGNPGTAGWCINKNGDAAFNTICVRTRSIENGAVTYQAMAGVGLSGAGASNNYWFNCEAGAQITATLLLNAESNDCPVASRINVAGPYPNFTTTSVLNTLGGGLYGYLSMSSSMGGSSEKFINTPGGRNVGIAMAIQFTADHTGSFYINVNFNNWGSCGNFSGYLTVVQGKR